MRSGGLEGGKYMMDCFVLYNHQCYKDFRKGSGTGMERREGGENNGLWRKGKGERRGGGVEMMNRRYEGHV